MAIKDIRKKLAKIVSTEPSNAMKNIEWSIKNRPWLRKSQQIAIKTLITIRKNKMDKEDLRKQGKFPKEKFKKILQGKYNLTLKDISILEEKLNIKF